MANFICWICSQNRPFTEYEGTKLLNEDGDMPCWECILEDEALSEEAENE